MTIPNLQILDEFAREVVRSHVQDIERMSVGEMMSGDPRFSEVTEGEFEDVEATIYDKAKAYAKALSWPDEPQEFECEVCTKPITAYPCVLCEHEPDPWKELAKQPQDDGNVRASGQRFANATEAVEVRAEELGAAATGWILWDAEGRWLHATTSPSDDGWRAVSINEAEAQEWQQRGAILDRMNEAGWRAYNAGDKARWQFEPGSRDAWLNAKAGT